MLKVSCTKRSHNPFKRKVTSGDTLERSPKPLKKQRPTVDCFRCH